MDYAVHSLRLTLLITVSAFLKFDVQRCRRKRCYKQTLQHCNFVQRCKEKEIEIRQFELIVSNNLIYIIQEAQLQLASHCRLFVCTLYIVAVRVGTTGYINLYEPLGCQLQAVV